jgi:hypothetical protein
LSLRPLHRASAPEALAVAITVELDGCGLTEREQRELDWTHMIAEIVAAGQRLELRNALQR